MIGFPFKRVYGLIGSPRDGKNSVAQFLEETRGFTSLAFADQIKEEFGIKKEDFEAAKISGEIDKIRKALWDFSEKKTKNNPSYFISSVMQRVSDLDGSVVITDIRTMDELCAIIGYKCSFNEVKMSYFVSRDFENSFKNGMLCESKLSQETILGGIEDCTISRINNNRSGLFYFYRDLDSFFAKEDLKHLLPYNRSWRESIDEYLKQFVITQRELL